MMTIMVRYILTINIYTPMLLYEHNLMFLQTLVLTFGVSYESTHGYNDINCSQI